MSNLSDLLPSGAGGKSFDFVASGTLASGQTVGLRSDGKVEAVGLTATGGTVGTPVVYEAANVLFMDTVYDSANNKIIINYRDGGNSNYGTAIVGTVSGTSISFGSPVVWNSATSSNMGSTFDSNSNKVVVAYGDGGASYNGKAIVGTVSGTSISFGSAATFESGGTAYQMSLSFDSTNNKILIAYLDNAAGQKGQVVVGTVSGTSISFGAISIFNNASTDYVSSTYDSSNNRGVIFYTASTNSNYGTAIVFSVSGTSVSLGSAVVYNSSFTAYPSAVFDTTSNKVVNAYYNNGKGAAIVGTVSGTSISFGTPAQYSASASWNYAAYDSSANKVVIVYKDDGSSDQGSVISATVSGTNITFGAITKFANVINGNTITCAYDTTSKQVIINYRDANNSNYGTAVTYTANSTSTNVASFVGITEAAIANTATGTVTLQGGINTTAITNTATTTFAITVANPGSGNRYYIDGALQATVSLSEGRTYKFDQSDGTNGGHPLRFSTTSDGSHGGGSEYTTGVTVVGVPGNSGAYTQIVVAIGAPTLYYYCTAHSGMGGTANTPDDARFTVGSTYYVQNDGTLGTGSTSIVAGEALSATSINLVNT